MPLTYAAIMPHGDELLEIHPPQPALEELRACLRSVGQDIRDAAPDLVVVCSPHHLRVPGHLAIADSAYLEGSLEGPLGAIRMRARTDRAANRAIAAAASAVSLPPAVCGYATAEQSDLSCLPLDWGSIVPLSFIAPDGPTVPIAVIGPPRDLGLSTLRRFGAALREALEPTHFALVASADLGHAHEASGPYGYDPASAVYDKAALNAVRTGDIGRLAALGDDVALAAKADAPWQLSILEGALGATQSPRHVAYARPTYFGMLCAGFPQPR